MIPFPFNENRFSFFVADYQLASCVQIPRAIGAFYHVWKWHNDQRARSEMRCCTTMLSTDPSYDNRTIASLLKMQIRTVQRLRAQFNASDNPSNVYGYGLWCGFKWGLYHATSYLRSRLESQHQSVPGCAEECGDQVASGRRWVWQQDSAPAYKSKETQAWLQKECYDFVPFSHWFPSSRPEPAGLLRLVICREHHQHDLPQHQSLPDRRHPPALGEKACSQFRIRIEVVIEAEGDYIE